LTKQQKNQGQLLCKVCARAQDAQA